MQLDTTILQGDWTMDGAGQRLKLLAGELAQLLAAEPRPPRVEIRLAELTSVDACGCQLLAVFLENLKRHGIAPAPGFIPPEVMEKIRLLGFADSFASTEAPGKESR